MDPEVAKAFRELVKETPFERILAVGNGRQRWEDLHWRGAIGQTARRTAVDVLDLLAFLPNKLGYESAEHFVCGYRPLGGTLAARDRAELEHWNSLCGEAANILRQPASEELYEPLQRLLGDLMAFVGERLRLHQVMTEARASREGPTA